MMDTAYYIGVDIGGTFTDVFVSDGENYWEGKSATTPGRLHEGLLDALAVASERDGESSVRRSSATPGSSPTAARSSPTFWPSYGAPKPDSSRPGAFATF